MERLQSVADAYKELENRRRGRKKKAPQHGGNRCHQCSVDCIHSPSLLLIWLVVWLSGKTLVLINLVALHVDHCLQAGKTASHLGQLSLLPSVG